MSNLDTLQTKSNLTRSQLLVWLGQQQFPDAPLYNMAITFEIDAALDVALFERAFRGVVADCDALRSVFEERAGQPYRRVVEKMDFGFEHVDISNADDPESACNEWCNQRQVACLDLARCPFDTALLQLGPDRFVWYLNQHHIITDGRSVSLIFEAAANRYQALCSAANNPDTQTESDTTLIQAERLPLFEDYAAYEQRLENEGRIERAKNHWQQRADHWSAVDRLQFFGRSQGHITTASDRFEIKLGSSRCDSLRALAASRQFASLTPEVNLFQILLTVFFAYLFRITGEPTLVIGAPSMNRTNARQRQTVGLLMQVFSLSVEIEHEETFKSLHRKVQAECLNFLRYAAPGAATPKITRAFNAVLNYTKVNSPNLCGATVKQRFHHAGHGEPHHLLRLQVQDFEHSEDLLLELDLNRGVFEEAAGPAAVGYFVSTLDAFLVNPGTRLDEYELLPSGERARLLDTLNPGTTPYSREQPLHVLFEEAAQLHPERLAVVSEQDQLSYFELNRRANRLAATLTQAGVGHHDIVGLRLERSVELVVAMLGVLKAGASYLPIVDDIPATRRDYMLDLAKVSLIVCSDALLDEIQAEGRRCVSVTGSGGSTVNASAKPGATSANIESPAYVLFTSGSTGDPKGVICRHRGVVNLLEAFEQLSCLPDGANCAWWCNASFDVSVYEIYSALAFGRTLHIVPEKARVDAKRLLVWLSEQRIESAYLPPFILNQMRVLLERGPANLRLERLLVGVEPIPEETLAGMAAALPKLQIINGYGPTEATICTTLYPLPERPACGRNVPIGRPVRNTSLYLLDAGRQLVPFGVVGEIYVGGDGLACGYLNRPDLTVESFVANTFSADPQARLYKTGDLARFLPNGDLLHLGRVDDQIKLRGQRIEPGEIERALLAHPSVRDALVIAEKADDDKRLVAYLVVEPLEGDCAAQWRQWLEARIARFMIPSAYVVLDAFPLTTSGKIDRNALPAPEDCDHTTQVSRPPAGPLEVELADIFTKVLELSEIGAETHFIELGGDSIRAMQIAALASDAGMKLSPRQIFEAGTIASLALVLQDSPQASKPIKSEAGNPVTARELAEVFAEFGEDLDSGGN